MFANGENKVRGSLSSKQRYVSAQMLIFRHHFYRNCCLIGESYRWIIRLHQISVMRFWLHTMVAGKAICGKHIVLYSEMPELQNCLKRPLISHDTVKSPFHANGRHFWLKVLGRDDWNDNQIKNAQLCSVHYISGKLRVSQPVCCDMQTVD